MKQRRTVSVDPQQKPAIMAHPLFRAVDCLCALSASTREACRSLGGVEVSEVGLLLAPVHDGVNFAPPPRLLEHLLRLTPWTGIGALPKLAAEGCCGGAPEQSPHSVASRQAFVE